jgi:hypothetical protein
VSSGADFFLKTLLGGDAAKGFALSRKDAKEHSEISRAEGAIDSTWRFAPKREQRPLAPLRLSVEQFSGNAAHAVSGRTHTDGTAC